jgi:hypothetical protein
LAENLALLTAKYPELEQIITAWPNLPEDIKSQIKALIEQGENRA